MSNLTRYTAVLIELLSIEREICTHPQNQPPKYLKAQAQEKRERLVELAEEIDLDLAIG